LLAVKDSGAIDHAAAMIKQQVSYDGVPLDHGFTVTRRYEPADHSSKIWKDQNGTWHTTYGAQIKAIIKFVPDHETNHAILKEFFPVGLTPNSSSIPEPFYHRGRDNQFSSRWDYSNNWAQKIDRTIDSLTVFGSFLPATEFNFQYTLRASSAGIFLVPPVQMTCPYDDQQFGRSGWDRLVVE
jgi:uncharacterized protein YfaS (alpha-2-macroglobulin family)